MFTNSGFKVRNIDISSTLSSNEVDLLMLRNRVFRQRNDQIWQFVMKGLRFADTQESCFEAWKSSQMGCSALLCGLFADFQESRFQSTKRSNMCSAVLEYGRSAYFHEFCFQAAKRSDMDCVELQGCRFADCQERHFQAAKRSDKSGTILQEVDFLMLRNRVFKVRNVEIWQCCPAMKLIC